MIKKTKLILLVSFLSASGAQAQEEICANKNAVNIIKNEYVKTIDKIVDRFGGADVVTQYSSDMASRMAESSGEKVKFTPIVGGHNTAKYDITNIKEEGRKGIQTFCSADLVMVVHDGLGQSKIKINYEIQRPEGGKFYFKLSDVTPADFGALMSALVTASETK